MASLPHPGRFFRRNPGWLFAARLLMFAGLLPLAIADSIERGKLPGRHGGSSWARAEHPYWFWTTIALAAAGAAFITIASTIIFLKKKRLVPKDWTLLGADFRF